MLSAEPKGLLVVTSSRTRRFGVVLRAEPKDLLETAADAAEGGRDTRVLGDPMDLIRCQSYLAKHGEHTVQQDTNMAL